MIKLNLSTLLLTTATLVVSCGTVNDAPRVPEKFNYEVNLKEAGITPEKIAGMDSLLQAFVDNKKMNCVAAFIAQGGNVVYKKAFGLKDIENQIPATVDDYYILFSQTKAITTVAFMTLVEKGLVAIDDSVSKYFPEIPDRVVTKVNEDGTYETRLVKSPMTFAHLMSHASGLNARLIGEIRKTEREKSDESKKTRNAGKKTKWPA